jgi:hypothetical protein
MWLWGFKEVVVARGGEAALSSSVVVVVVDGDELAPLMMAVCFVIHSHHEPYVGC